MLTPLQTARRMRCLGGPEWDYSLVGPISVPIRSGVVGFLGAQRPVSTSFAPRSAEEPPNTRQVSL